MEAAKKEGSCLLNIRRSLTKMDAQALAFEAQTVATQVEAHRLWRQQHAVKVTEVNHAKDVLDDFIKAQKKAGTACSARLMEAKRALDRLLEDAKSLSTQITSHESVLETENEKLKLTMISVASVEKDFADDVKECDNMKADALKEMKQYSAELKELQEIANPKAKYTDKLGLLEFGAFTRERCLAFVNFVMRHEQHGAGGALADPKSCDKQRAELQTAFTKAYKDVVDLHADAKERSEDKSCYDDADAKKTAALVPLVTQQEQTTARIERANDAVDSLKPALEVVKGRATKLKDHIDEELTPECFEAGEVSKVLAHIRELIMLVEECPGASGFKLKIPEVKEASATSDKEPDANEPEVAVEPPKVLPTITPKVATTKPYKGEINLPEPKETAKTLDYAPVQQRS